MIKKEDIPERHHEAAHWLTQLSLNFDERSSGVPMTPTTRPPIVSFMDHIKKSEETMTLTIIFYFL